MEDAQVSRTEAAQSSARQHELSVAKEIARVREEEHYYRKQDSEEHARAIERLRDELGHSQRKREEDVAIVKEELQMALGDVSKLQEEVREGRSALRAATLKATVVTASNMWECLGKCWRGQSYRHGWCE